MLWADVSLIERWNGLDSFLKLLVIPLLMVQFRRSDNGQKVFIAFLIACVALLIASWLVTIWPQSPWKTSPDDGVMVKSYIVQSAEFTMCAFALLYLVVRCGKDARADVFGRAVWLALAFLADIFFIATSRTSLLVIPLLRWRSGRGSLGGKDLSALPALCSCWLRWFGHRQVICAPA